MASSMEFLKKSEQIELNENNFTTQLKPRLLLIEVHSYLTNVFSSSKVKSNYQVSKGSFKRCSPDDYNNHLLQNSFDMIIVYVDFSESSTLSTICDIRSLFHGLLVIVSSQYSEQEQVDVFELGVDEYIAKPTDSRILTMRIAGLFRRQNNQPAPMPSVALASLTSGNICLLPKAQKCLVNGEQVKLTAFEFKLLKALVESKGNILSRDKLYVNLLGRIYNGVERTLDVRMSKLREKLILAGMNKNHIETVWGQGYMFNGNL